ncbi:MAG: hypothetical protein JXR73_04790, partial [Candidatus Omnitrophica bacterium]|nr:hypothetical protein [Candidatus Omnitrophota bacterium]
ENHRDNIEQVFIANPGDGLYTIRIGGRVNWGNAQNFVLCISGLRLLERETKLLILQPRARHRTAGVNPIHIFATSESGVTGLRIELDGVVMDDPDTPRVDGLLEYAAPQLIVNHRFNWDTTHLPNGEHLLAMTIQDASGEILSKNMPMFILNDQDYMPLTAGGDPVMQELSETNDRDWFVIRPPESGYYAIETHALSDYQAPDTVLILYGPNNQKTVLIENDDGGIETLSKIVCFLESDQTYYVRVSKYLGGVYSQDDSLYAIDFQSVAPEQAQLAITPIRVNDPPISGEIVDIGEEHWYQFDSQVLATYIIEAFPPEEHAADRFQFDLYTPDNLTLPIESGDFDRPLFRVFGKDHSYLLKITSPKTTGRYTISVQTLSEISTYYLEINSPPKTGSFQASEMEEAWYIFEAREFTTYFMELFTESPDIAASTYFILYGPDDPAREYVRSQMRGADYTRIFMPLRGGHIYFLQILKKSGAGEYAVQVKTPDQDLPFTPSGSPPTILNNENRAIVNPLSGEFFESAVSNWSVYQ